MPPKRMNSRTPRKHVTTACIPCREGKSKVKNCHQHASTLPSLTATSVMERNQHVEIAIVRAESATTSKVTTSGKFKYALLWVYWQDGLTTSFNISRSLDYLFQGLEAKIMWFSRISSKFWSSHVMTWILIRSEPPMGLMVVVLLETKTTLIRLFLLETITII